MTTARRWTASLRFRLLAATVVALALALVLAGVLLSGLFREHVMRQFETVLTQQLDQLTARLEFDAAGQPRIDTSRLSDPRWQRPFSGLYWQLDRIGPPGAGASPALRSRSLWDTTLTLPADVLPAGRVHVHHSTGPQNAALLLVERRVNTGEAPGTAWRLAVAADMKDATRAVERFNGELAASLSLLGLLLVLAAWAQVAVGLSPLRSLQAALDGVQAGRAQRLQGRFPTEVQPLIDGFNGVLDRHAEVVERARTQAGNLAHALKTPLAVLAQAADGPGTRAQLADCVREQSALSRRQIDWQLKRARVAASQRLPGQRTAVAPVLDGLVRVLDRVHAARQLALRVDLEERGLCFAGEEQDLQEMLGNVLENACLWARQQVVVRCHAGDGGLHVVMEDDGPGIAPDQRDAVLARGVRLDEAMPGSGLGLAIVADLVALYGGTIALDTADLGGLRVSLKLPAAGCIKR